MSGTSDFFDMLGVKASIDIKTYEKDIKAKDKEIERLNNIIKEAQDYLRSTTHLLLEYNKPFRKVGKYEEQYCKRESDLRRILKGEKVEWGIILDKGE